jgi:hypothetical protein
MTEQPCSGERSYPPPRTHPLHPPSEYGWPREYEPVARVRLADGRDAWLITRYDDVRAAYADSVSFSSDRTQPGFSVRAAAAATYTDNPTSVIGMDGAEAKPLWADPATKRRAYVSLLAAGAGLPLHRHVGDELVYVIEGELAVLGGGQVRRRGTGASARRDLAQLRRVGLRDVRAAGDRGQRRDPR